MVMLAMVSVMVSLRQLCPLGVTVMLPNSCPFVGSSAAMVFFF